MSMLILCDGVLEMEVFLFHRATPMDVTEAAAPEGASGEAKEVKAPEPTRKAIIEAIISLMKDTDPKVRKLNKAFM